MTERPVPYQFLSVLEPGSHHKFVLPAKRIIEGQDVSFFLTSRAYTDILSFLFQLNAAMFPRRAGAGTETLTWELESEHVPFSPPVSRLKQLLERLGRFMDEAPPDTGPRRFGNVSFRKWYEIVGSRVSDLLDEHLPENILRLGGPNSNCVTAKAELQAYFVGSFGSAQRLDYGTGHELSFLAFLGCIWKLGGFAKADPGVEERGIVLGVVQPYLQLIRRLILTYTLEPAGSHGVWGLDDHSFLPYIFGSAQLSPPITAPADVPAEGSLSGAPAPADVAKPAAVQRERSKNMYFSAVGFVYDVKRGPFWEHSPILFDISGVKAGWAKINKGMLKMYNAEVLSKFPVVQHFPFGSLFVWERDPHAIPPPASAHGTSHQSRLGPPPAHAGTAPLRDPMQAGMRAPWAAPEPSGGVSAGTPAPWAAGLPSRAPPGAGAGPTARAPWAQSARLPASSATAPTAAPWTQSGRAPQGPGSASAMALTRAPWSSEDTAQ